MSLQTAERRILWAAPSLVFSECEHVRERQARSVTLQTCKSVGRSPEALVCRIQSNHPLADPPRDDMASERPDPRGYSGDVTKRTKRPYCFGVCHTFPAKIISSPEGTSAARNNATATKPISSQAADAGHTIDNTAAETERIDCHDTRWKGRPTKQVCRINLIYHNSEYTPPAQDYLKKLLEGRD